MLQSWEKVSFCALLSTCPDLSLKFSFLFFTEMFADFVLLYVKGESKHRFFIINIIRLIYYTLLVDYTAAFNRILSVMVAF